MGLSPTRTAASFAAPDPGVPFFSTGLFESTRFRIGRPKENFSSGVFVAVASSEVGAASVLILIRDEAQRTQPNVFRSGFPERSD